MDSEIGTENRQTILGANGQIANVRVGESLHEKAAIAAIDRGIKLNEFVRQAIEHELRG